MVCVLARGVASVEVSRNSIDLGGHRVISERIYRIGVTTVCRRLWCDVRQNVSWLSGGQNRKLVIFATCVLRSGVYIERAMNYVRRVATSALVT